jgi:hypothetical protein
MTSVPTLSLTNLPLRSLFLQWGEAQVLHWTDPLAQGEEVLVRATVTNKPRGWGSPGSLVLTNRRLIWIWGLVRLAKALVIPRSAIRDVSYDPSTSLVIKINYLDNDGLLRELRFRPYSYWEGPASGAMGGVFLAGPAAAAAGHLAIGTALRLAPGSRRKATLAVRALRAGLGLPIETPTEDPVALPQDIGGFTLRSLLLMPGLGVLTLLALAGLVIALFVYAGAQQAKVAYLAQPACSSGQSGACVELESAILTARGTGNHNDGTVSYGANWLQLRLSNGHAVYADFLDSAPLESVPIGAPVFVKLRDGIVMAVGTKSERLASTADSPVYGAQNSTWLVLLFLIGFLLSSAATASIAIAMVRRRQLPWRRSGRPGG